MSTTEEGKSQSRSEESKPEFVPKSSPDEKSKEGDSKSASEEPKQASGESEKNIEEPTKEPIITTTTSTTRSKKTDSRDRDRDRDRARDRDLEEAPLPESNTNLIINYLPPGMTEGGLATLFSPYGVMKNCKIVVDYNTQKSRGYGFVEYESSKSAEKARTTLNGYACQGKKLKVAFARPQCKEIMNSNLYITGLPPEFETRDLQKLFVPFGRLIECRVLRDGSGKSRGVGFVRLGTHADAEAALRTLDSKPVHSGGRPIRVKLATNRAAPNSRGGRGRRGGTRGGGRGGRNPRGSGRGSGGFGQSGTTSGGRSNPRGKNTGSGGQRGMGPGGELPSFFDFSNTFDESAVHPGIYGQYPYGFGYNPYRQTPFFDPYTPFSYPSRYPPFDPSFPPPFYPGNLGLSGLGDLPPIQRPSQQGGSGGKSSSSKKLRSKKGDKGQKGTSSHGETRGNGLTSDISAGTLGSLPLGHAPTGPPVGSGATGKSGPFTVMVYDLPPYFNEDHLIQHFAKFGPITDVKVWRDNDHLAKGVGEISYFYYQDAQRAVTKMDERRIGVKNVKVRHSDPKK